MGLSSCKQQNHVKSDKSKKAAGSSNDSNNSGNVLKTICFLVLTAASGFHHHNKYTVCVHWHAVWEDVAKLVLSPYTLQVQKTGLEPWTLVKLGQDLLEMLRTRRGHLRQIRTAV